MQASVEHNISSQLGSKREYKFCLFLMHVMKEKFLQQMLNLILPFDKSGGV
jgi:hypothetical protein